MKIAFFNMKKYEIGSEERILSELKDDEVVFFHDALSQKLIKEVKDFDIICISPFTTVNKKFIDSFSNLKLICTMSTGFDHIDLDECRRLKIKVCNVPVYGENRIAEYTFSLILAMSTRLFDSVSRTKNKLFFENDESLRGFELYEKTIGLIGCGNIGLHVARFAKSMDMRVYVYDIVKNRNLAKKYGFEYVTMNKLLKESDIVSLHVPYNRGTHHLIDSKKFEMMKEGVCFVNTARGAVVDTFALLESLENGKIKYCALDVLENEFDFCSGKSLSKNRMDVFRANLEIMRRDNVIVTPHNGANSTESLNKIVDTTVDNVIGFMNKKDKDVNYVD